MWKHSCSHCDMLNTRAKWRRHFCNIEFRRCSVAVNLKAEADGVDGEDRAAGVVLQRSRQEGLWEEEAADPEHSRNPAGDPALQETDALQQVGYPGGQRL